MTQWSRFVAETGANSFLPRLRQRSGPPGGAFPWKGKQPQILPGDAGSLTKTGQCGLRQLLARVPHEGNRVCKGLSRNIKTPGASVVVKAHSPSCWRQGDCLSPGIQGHLRQRRKTKYIKEKSSNHEYLEGPGNVLRRLGKVSGVRSHAALGVTAEELGRRPRRLSRRGSQLDSG